MLNSERYLEGHVHPVSAPANVGNTNGPDWGLLVTLGWGILMDLGGEYS